MKTHTFIRNCTYTLVVFFAVTALQVSASTNCTFDRDLDIGVEGSDVRCLQQWLNENGYALTESGPGAPGAETQRYGALTRDALARWQADHAISPARGFFGPQTRAMIASLSGVVSSDTEETSVPQTPDVGVPVDGGVPMTQEQENPVSTDVTQTYSGDVSKLILDAVRMVYDAKDAIDDSEVGAAELASAQKDYDDARDDLLAAVYALFTDDIEEARDAADDAYDNAVDALESAGGVTEEDEVDTRIDALKDDLEDSWDRLDDMADDGDDVSDAEGYLEDADVRFDEAKDAFKKKEYSTAQDLLDEVEDLIDDAFDVVVGSDEKDAQDAIDDAKDAIADAADVVDEARADGEAVDDAEDLLDDAEDLLDDAEDAFDDKDYRDAIEFAKDAEDKADDAADEV